MNEQQALVSVTMAAYNAEKYISESIEGILSQTYQNWELVIVNDGSTDSTLEIATRYAAQDSRIIVHSNEKNSGFYYTLNKAISFAKGKYIAVNDADDISMPTRLEKQVSFFENNPEYTIVASLVRCFYDKVFDNGKKPWGSIENLEGYHFNYISPDGDYAKTNAMIEKGMIETNRLCHSSVMARAEFYKTHHYKNVFAEDSELFVRAVLMKKKITKIPEILLHYRITGSGLSAGFSELKTKKALQELKGLDREIVKEALKAKNFPFLFKFLVHRAKLYGIFRMNHKIRGLMLKILKVIKNALPISVQKQIRRLFSFLTRYSTIRKIPLVGRFMMITLSVLNADEAVTPQEQINGSVPCYNIGIWTIEKKWLMGGLYTILMMAAEILKKGNSVRFINYGLSNDVLKNEFLTCLKDLYKLSDDDISRVQINYFFTLRNRYEEFHKDDRFIAGYWSPAEDIQKIHKKSDHFNSKVYSYIIQDYEPSMLYRWGSEYVRSYNTFLDDNYYPVFNNSTFVCNYVKKLGLITKWTDDQILHGEPCKTEPANVEKMTADASSIRLVFYSRPTVDKNIYEIKIEALKLFIDALEKKNPHALSSLVITGIGETAPSITYKGVKINNHGKLNYDEYPTFIQDYNIGLACIISPAFAYPCLEFPRAGIVTVVNKFETRDLEKFTKNIISCDNTAESICEKLLQAVDGIKDIETRQSASSFQLPGVGIKHATEHMLKFLENGVPVELR